MTDHINASLLNKNIKVLIKKNICLQELNGGVLFYLHVLACALCFIIYHEVKAINATGI